MRRDAYDANDDGIIDRIGIVATAGIGGINAYQVVLMSTSEEAIPADGSNSTHAGLVVGMAPTAIAEGEDGTVQQIGEIENVTWNLDPGEIYYVGVAGTIAKTPPTTGFWQKIGIAKDSVTLILNIGEAIKVI